MERLEKGRFLCWRFGACILLAATISAAASLPVGSVLQPNEVKALLAQWQEQYHAVLVDLRANDPKLTKRARKHASVLNQDIVDRAISGEALCQSAGRVLVLLAIAEVRLGDRDDGVWHWQMAQNVSSDLRSQDFAEFTDIAPLMKESLIPEDRWNGLRRNAKGEIQIGEKDHPPEVVPPKLKERVAPRYPAGLEAQRVAEATVVEAIIGKDGRLREPIVRRGCGHISLDLAAMEALKDWVYEPARLDGRPVSVFLSVNVNFALDRWHGSTPILPVR